jgi:hypothetical protein
MRAESARDEHSMLHPARQRVIRAIVFRAGTRQGVVIERFVNVGNHLHLRLRTKSRRMFEARPALCAFLRETAGLTARAATGARKGNPAQPRWGMATPKRDGRKFWDGLVWSRVMSWGRDLASLDRYFRKNERDAARVLAENSWPDLLLDTS